MRTRFLILLTLCLVLGLVAVSCNADSALVEEEVLVSVSFENGSARSLSASLEGFDTGNYYWYYKATKADGSKFRSGQTTGFVAVQDVRGLCKVSGFSQGLWDFELEAYVDSEKEHLVYKGKTEGVMLMNPSANDDGCNIVSVIVSPLSNQGNGTLTVALDAITAASNYPGTLSGIVLSYAAYGSDSWTDIVNAEHSVSLAPGTYVVRVTFNFTGGGHATSSVVATVYSNLVTTVGGNMTSTVVSGN